VHPSQIVPVVLTVYESSAFDSLPIVLQEDPTTYSIDRAWVDTHNGVQNVPAHETQGHFTHKHGIDPVVMEAALQRIRREAPNPDLPLLRLFFTMFTDDFGTYGKVK
jgi:hypothetical protein